MTSSLLFSTQLTSTHLENPLKAKRRKALGGVGRARFAPLDESGSGPFQQHQNRPAVRSGSIARNSIVCPDGGRFQKRGAAS